MDTKTLERELIHFGQDQIKVLGKPLAGRYIARCIALWRGNHGDAMADKVREKLRKAWDETA